MNSKTHLTKIFIIWLSIFFTSFTNAQNTVDELINPNLVAFQEDEVTLPKAPIGKNLLQFFPSSNASLNFFVDSQSLSFVKDLIIKFTVQIQNSSGVVQTVYIGMSCERYEYRQYAFFEKSGAWRVSENTSWRRIPPSGYNQYLPYIAKNGFCISNSVNSSQTDALKTLFDSKSPTFLP
jgi:hypothetical protein